MTLREFIKVTNGLSADVLDSPMHIFFNIRNTDGDLITYTPSVTDVSIFEENILVGENGSYTDSELKEQITLQKQDAAKDKTCLVESEDDYAILIPKNHIILHLPDMEQPRTESINNSCIPHYNLEQE